MSDDRPMLGVSTCLLSGDAVLLVTRGRPPLQGLLSLPGGRVERGETLAEAARREVEEETGLRIAPPRFHRLHEAIGPDFHALIAVHAAAMPEGALPQAASDAHALALVPLAELAELEAAGRTTPGLAAIVLSAAEECGAR